LQVAFQRFKGTTPCLASYRSPDGGVFAFADELAEKRRQLRENEAMLAADIDADASQAPAA
jgi:hypothetical protein